MSKVEGRLNLFGLNTEYGLIGAKGFMPTSKAFPDQIGSNYKPKENERKK